MKVTYVGEEKFVHEAGFDFINGQPVDVPDDHPRAEKFANNPTFSVEGYEAEKPDPKAKERAEKVSVMKALDTAGIEYDARLSIDKLRKLLESGGEPEAEPVR